MSEVTDEVGLWAEKYRPVKNHFVPDSGWDGELFETYGEEGRYIRSLDPAFVWTWVDGDGSILLSGYHWVNRIGYLVTRHPCTEIDSVSVQVEEYSDEN